MSQREETKEIEAGSFTHEERLRAALAALNGMLAKPLLAGSISTGSCDYSNMAVMAVAAGDAVLVRLARDRRLVSEAPDPANTSSGCGAYGPLGLGPAGDPRNGRTPSASFRLTGESEIVYWLRRMHGILDRVFAKAAA